ncbi:MAG: hypothetical protein HPY52_16930 [Firmicutes bacterium]|nr:hypothetical protein [Bacillota bacterium]
MHNKQELREMSRIETIRVVREVLATYRERRTSGRITVDVRSGKAIWVKPAVADVEAPEAFPDEAKVLQELDETLREFQGEGVSGTVALVVCAGRGVGVEKVVELEKVRVG